MSESVNEHDNPEDMGAPDDLDALADEMSIESFPSSDPPSTWAGADHG